MSKKLIFPKKLSVLGEKYLVKEIPSPVIDGREVSGLMLPIEQWIVVCSELPDKHRLKTLIHEYVHAVKVAIGLDQVLNDNECEIWAQTMATSMYQFIVQMGWFKE